ncbi:MAG: arylesterase [Hyphomonadaceae bacterium]|jgi:acyl-CoA thioesterase-1|nr:arylesterase [Hyphomonadaceae bacterium]
MVTDLLPNRRSILAALAALGLPAEGLAQASGGRTTARRYNLVMVGDSLTAGYGLQRSQSYPFVLQGLLQQAGIAVRIVNAGVSGDTTASALARFDFAVPRGTDGVFIAIGGNDLLQGLPVAQARANIDAMIRAGKARGARVAIAGMRAPANWGATYRRAFDAMYPDLARVHQIALDPFLLEGVALNPRLNQSDGIHPNAAGAARIATRLVPFITRTYGLAPAAAARN